MMTKGDKVTMDGKEWTVAWSSDEMTDEDRYKAHLLTADFMEQYGLSGDIQRAMAEKYRAAIAMERAETENTGSVAKP